MQNIRLRYETYLGFWDTVIRIMSSLLATTAVAFFYLIGRSDSFGVHGPSSMAFYIGFFVTTAYRFGFSTLVVIASNHVALTKTMLQELKSGSPEDCERIADIKRDYGPVSVPVDLVVMCLLFVIFMTFVGAAHSLDNNNTGQATTSTANLDFYLLGLFLALNVVDIFWDSIYLLRGELRKVLLRLMKALWASMWALSAIIALLLLCFAAIAAFVSQIFSLRVDRLELEQVLIIFVSLLLIWVLPLGMRRVAYGWAASIKGEFSDRLGERVAARLRFFFTKFSFFIALGAVYVFELGSHQDVFAHKADLQTEIAHFVQFPLAKVDVSKAGDILSLLLKLCFAWNFVSFIINRMFFFSPSLPDPRTHLAPPAAPSEEDEQVRGPFKPA